MVISFIVCAENKIKDFAPLSSALSALSLASAAGLPRPAAIAADAHPHLELLDVSDNEVSSLAGLRYFSGLKSASLKGNRITKLDGLSDCTSLTRIDLSYNLVESFHELKKLSALKHLTHLSVAGNEALHYEAANGGPAAVAAAAAAQARENAAVNGDGDEKDPNAPAAAAPLSGAAAPVSGNPMAAGSGVVDDAFVLEALILLPQLQVLDGIVITVKQRKQAHALHKERLAEAARLADEEKKRLEEERLDNPDAADGGQPSAAGEADGDALGSGRAGGAGIDPSASFDGNPNAVASSGGSVLGAGGDEDGDEPAAQSTDG